MSTCAPLPHKSDTEWLTADRPVDYDAACAFMESRVADIREQGARDCIWLIEHPPLYTAGTSAKESDLLNPRFPVHATGRGGQYTYHGPGQRVVYAMMDLHKRGSDVRCYVHDLEQWMIDTIATFGVKGERREGRVGIWVDLGPYGRVGEAKIGAIGVRLRKWVAFHGMALNVAPDLSHYAGIVPCGISAHGVTSLADLGIDATMADVDAALKKSFEKIFAGAS